MSIRYVESSKAISMQDFLVIEQINYHQFVLLITASSTSSHNSLT
jgi:hypothetical protein